MGHLGGAAKTKRKVARRIGLRKAMESRCFSGGATSRGGKGEAWEGSGSPLHTHDSRKSLLEFMDYIDKSIH